MALAALIGSGPVGRYAAKYVLENLPEAHLIGLTATRPWLGALAPNASFTSSAEFGKCLEIFRQFAITEVIFVGEPFGSFKPKTDATTIKYLFKNMSLWYPHGYLNAIRAMLEDNGIRLRSCLDVLPALAAESGFRAGDCNGYDPEPDFRAAEKSVRSQPLKTIRQSYIVDSGKIIMSEKSKTDELIRDFGKSSRGKSTAFPVLCKLPIVPFENIDVPTIGATTVRLCSENGIRAVVVQGGRTILMQRSEVLEFVRNRSVCVAAI